MLSGSSSDSSVTESTSQDEDSDSPESNIHSDDNLLSNSNLANFTKNRQFSHVNRNRILIHNRLRNRYPQAEDEGSTDISLTNLLSNGKFDRYLLFNFVFIFTIFLPNVFIVNYGGRWFGGCDPSSTTPCPSIDYEAFNFYNSLALSLRGVVAFLFAGFVGRLSDSWGRKGFIILHPVLYGLQMLPLVVNGNFMWYLLLTPLSGLVGETLGLSPMMSAYVSDVLPVKLRTLGFAISYTSAGIALLLSAVMSLLISLLVSDGAVFDLCLGLFTFLIFYNSLCIPESLELLHRKPLYWHNVLNPCRPLFQIGNNPIIFWISCIQFLITFMEVGILNISMVYILTQLNISSISYSNIVMFSFTAAASVGVFFATIVVLPLSAKYPLGINCLKRFKMFNHRKKRRPPLTPVLEHEELHSNAKDDLEEKAAALQLSDVSSDTTETSVPAMNPIMPLTPPARYIHYKPFTKPEPRPSLDAASPQPQPTILSTLELAQTEDRKEEKSTLETINPTRAYESIISQREQVPVVMSDSKLDLARINNCKLNKRHMQLLQRDFPIEQYEAYNDKMWIDYNNFLTGVIMSFVSLVLIGLIAFFKSVTYTTFCGIVVGTAIGLTFPSANGLATNCLRKDEQGKGFGIIYSVKGITSSIAPFAFGTFYNYLHSYHLGPMIFLMAMVLTMTAFFLIIFPLRVVLIEAKGAYKRTQFLINAMHPSEENLQSYT